MEAAERRCACRCRQQRGRRGRYGRSLGLCRARDVVRRVMHRAGGKICCCSVSVRGAPTPPTLDLPSRAQCSRARHESARNAYWNALVSPKHSHACAARSTEALAYSLSNVGDCACFAARLLIAWVSLLSSQGPFLPIEWRHATIFGLVGISGLVRVWQRAPCVFIRSQTSTRSLSARFVSTCCRARGRQLLARVYAY